MSSSVCAKSARLSAATKGGRSGANSLIGAARAPSHLRRCAAQGARLAPKRQVVAKAEPAKQTQTSEYYAPGSGKVPPPTAGGDTYDVYLNKPLGLKFARGFDGAAYIVGIDGTKGSIDNRMEPGDKIMKISASFGADVWEAKNYGQVMYAIRTRNGQVYLNIKKNYGDMTALEAPDMTEAEVKWMNERNGGNYGAGTAEMQQRNYVSKKEGERKRRELFDDALMKFKSGKIEAALIDFEEVIGMEPKNYVGDNFARVTDIYRVTQYNMACCYSSLNQVDAGLDALKAALLAGYEDFKKVRNDPNLAKLRQSPEFKPLVDKFDEPVFNEQALKAVQNLFSFGKKK